MDVPLDGCRLGITANTKFNSVANRVLPTSNSLVDLPSEASPASFETVIAMGASFPPNWQTITTAFRKLRLWRQLIEVTVAAKNALYPPRSMIIC
jgi:hypothetical protein